MIVVLSVSGLASDVLTRLDLDLDGLLLIMVSLLMAGLFLLMLFVIAKDQGWLPGGHKTESPPLRRPAPRPLRLPPPLVRLRPNRKPKCLSPSAREKGSKLRARAPYSLYARIAIHSH